MYNHLNPPLSLHFAGFMHANILPQVRSVNVGLGKGWVGSFAETELGPLVICLYRNLEFKYILF